MLNNYAFNTGLGKYPLDDPGGGPGGGGGPNGGPSGGGPGGGAGAAGMFAVSVSSDAGVNAAALLMPQQQQQQQQSQQQQAQSLQQAQQQQQQHDSQQQQNQQQQQSQQQHDSGNDVDVKEHTNGKRKHCVWDYYDLSSGKAQCRTCCRFISATTTLAKGHLKAFHPGVLAEVEQKEEHRRELNPVGTAPKRRKTPQLAPGQPQQSGQPQPQAQHQMQQLQMLGAGGGDAMSAARSAALYDIKPFVGSDLYGRSLGGGAGGGKPPPTVRLSRTETFSAAHRLHSADYSEAQNRDLYGACNNANGHGHNYEWTAVLEGPVSVHTGMVYDLAELKRAMADVLASVDHKNLDLDLDYFRNSRLVSTTENLCVYLYDRLKSKLKRPELLKKVVVGETSKNRFSYSGG